MDTRVGRWDSARWGSPTLDSVRALLPSTKRFRVSFYRYPAGADFRGAAIAGRWYVLEGSCTIMVGSSSWVLVTGDIVQLPAGEYRLCLDGSGPVELVCTWESPTGANVADA